MSAVTETKVYQPISRRGFEAIRDNLTGNGIYIPDAPAGTISAPHGFTVAWRHVPPLLEIRLTGPAWLMGFAFGSLSERIEPFVGR